ncbi:hypothetical protein Taro_005278 [Colocasia esculenta]|uniref:Peptidase S8/S53 domain-containing protein n=1 Tax=Colocasia esculenta TaxID=4460 RepID=A0A843TSI1_COLES|nr:hypothetical protein [Colocasia esculenta]
MDAVVADGVDVMSLSLAGEPEPLHSNMIAVIAFGVIKKGVFISCAAGNDGPDEKSVTNGAPWILTVAASTMNRSLEANVKLGNGSKFHGQSAFHPPGSRMGCSPWPSPTLTCPMTATDRRLLQATTVTPDVVVAADDSGNYRTVAPAVVGGVLAKGE